MESVIVNYLKRQRDVMVKLTGVAVVFLQRFGIVWYPRAHGFSIRRM